MELLTRVACLQNKLGSRPCDKLEGALHIMDSSDGKAKLSKSSRRSVSIRHFVFSVAQK